MQKPHGYEEAQVMGEYTPVELGGHYATVLQVTETQSSTGKDMIVVVFDLAKQDKQPGRFRAQFDNDDRNDKKWPYAGTMYIMVNDYQDASKTSRNFKTFCTAVEHSNNMQIAWGGNDWAKQFKGKKVGVVYGEVETEYNGEVKMRRNPRWFCSWDKVADTQVPNPKYLNGSGPAAPASESAPAQASPDGFLNVPEGADDEIPF